MSYVTQSQLDDVIDGFNNNLIYLHKRLLTAEENLGNVASVVGELQDDIEGSQNTIRNMYGDLQIVERDFASLKSNVIESFGNVQKQFDFHSGLIGDLADQIADIKPNVIPIDEQGTGGTDPLSAFLAGLGGGLGGIGIYGVVILGFLAFLLLRKGK